MQKMNSLLKDIHIAKVIDNAHEDKNGLIKISIPYLHYEIQESLLPWALPLHNFLGGSATSGLSVIPEIDSYVYIFFENEKLHKNPVYVGNVNSKDVNIDKLFEDNIKTNISGFEGTYPNVKFLITDNGICIGFSTEADKPEVFIYHPKSYLYINKDGNMEYKDNDNNNIKLTSSGIDITDAQGNTIKANGTTLTLNSNLEVLQ